MIRNQAFLFALLFTVSVYGEQSEKEKKPLGFGGSYKVDQGRGAFQGGGTGGAGMSGQFGGGMNGMNGMNGMGGMNGMNGMGGMGGFGGMGMMGGGGGGGGGGASYEGKGKELREKAKEESKKAVEDSKKAVQEQQQAFEKMTQTFASTVKSFQIPDNSDKQLKELNEMVAKTFANPTLTSDGDENGGPADQLMAAQKDRVNSLSAGYAALAEKISSTFGPAQQTASPTTQVPTRSEDLAATEGSRSKDPLAEIMSNPHSYNPPN